MATDNGSIYEEYSFEEQRISRCDNIDETDSASINRASSAASVATSGVSATTSGVSATTSGESATPPENVSYEFGVKELIFASSALALFYFDLVSDVLITMEYYKKDITWEFIVTAVFVIVPSVIICILGLRNYRLKYETHVSLLWIFRYTMTLLMMGPAISYLEYIYYGIKYRIKNSKLEPGEKKCLEDYYLDMREQHTDSCTLRMMECFLEAAPQLIIQIYIFMQHDSDEELFTVVIRVLAIVSSWMGVSWSLVSTARAHRLEKDDDMTYSDMGFYFLWRVTETGTRIIALSFITIQYGFLVVCIVVGAHWVIMIVYKFHYGDKFSSLNCMEKLYVCVQGYLLVFCFMEELITLRSRYGMLFYYVVGYLENLVMLCLWFFFTDDKSTWFYIPTLVAIASGVVLQLFFQLTYYIVFHPRGPGKIPPCCQSQEEYTSTDDANEDEDQSNEQNVQSTTAVV